MKKLKYFLIILVATLISVPSVSAEVKYQSTSYKLINRDFNSFPFTTWFSNGENSSYLGNNYVEFVSPNTDISTVDDLPKYVYAIYCGTAKLNLSTIDDSSNKGRISNQGAVKGGTCEVNYNGGYYTGNYYLNRWLVYNYNYYSGEMGQSYGVKWSINIHNTAGYNVFVRFESMFVSNELINDFSSDYLLSSLISQNSSLRSELNEVKTNTSETNNKLDETNQELGEVNDNITNDEVGGVDGAFENFEGFVSENSTITQLITMPITLYTSILNGVQSTCQPFSLGNLFGTNLTLPCINIGNYLGSTLWTMIDVIISGFAIFSISKKLIKIFNNFSTMKEGDVIDD